MLEDFETVAYALQRRACACFDPNRTDSPGMALALNTAFLIALAGPSHPAHGEVKAFLSRLEKASDWQEAAKFLTRGIRLIQDEIRSLPNEAPETAERLKALAAWVRKGEGLDDEREAAQRFWSFFFPEGRGIRNNWKACVASLRKRRTVSITSLNPHPITNPLQEILFTSNVLLTLPPESNPLDGLPLSDELRKALSLVREEPQLYWYDHPIQVGVAPDKNEVFWGLRGLESAVDFERNCGHAPAGQRLTCLLSVSVTHKGLKRVAKKFLEETLTLGGGFHNMDVYAFTEADTERLRKEILAPAALHYLHQKSVAEDLTVLGVDGEYGRHYSFLKGIALFWKIFVRPELRATFKVDLDQVFPEEALVAETDASAFGHLRTPLWGAQGRDSSGRPVELGMIAGALVNERDMHRSVFTPDVIFEDRRLSPDELVFYSALPQALSTEAEMMTRYLGEDLDGKTRCVQRVHVTGGTTGILVDSLRRFRPFTPSFIGRAEDQAYLFSVLIQPGPKLAYVHKDGLIMRHDKEAFAQEAIQSGYLAKLVGDYLRILYFSAYAGALTDNIAGLKEAVDPFTGCFISRIPCTVVYLRFALKVATFFMEGKESEGVEFLTMGASRLMKALDFVDKRKAFLEERLEQERSGWNLYFDILTEIEEGLRGGDPFALNLRKKARAMIDQCAVRT